MLGSLRGLTSSSSRLLGSMVGGGLSSTTHPPTTSKKEFLYELKGVVAHVGTSDSGHYYSFIKDEVGGWVGGWVGGLID